MRVGDLVKLTWQLSDRLDTPKVGIVTHVEDISRNARERKDFAVTAVFGDWQTTQLDEYFEVLSVTTSS